MKIMHTLAMNTCITESLQERGVDAYVTVCVCVRVFTTNPLMCLDLVILSIWRELACA
jgi:hypothetical protein